MKKIGMGLIGPGFVATHHIDAVRRLGDVDVVAIAGSSPLVFIHSDFCRFSRRIV